MVRTVSQRFQEVGFTADFGPEGSRLLVKLYRNLADTGRAVPLCEALGMAAEIGMSPGDATALLDKVTERGESGEIRGIVGLSLNDHRHRLNVVGVALHNWCALDPLLIVPFLGKPALIESQDPQTGQLVRISVELDGRVTPDPASAVVSIVIPTEGIETVEQVWMLFCHHVHFFADRKAGEEYFADKEMEVYFLTVEEAFELGRLVFGPVHLYAAA